jgi:hypothetical protein
LHDTGVELMISNNVSVNAGQSLTLQGATPGTLKASGVLAVEGWRPAASQRRDHPADLKAPSA